MDGLFKRLEQDIIMNKLNVKNYKFIKAGELHFQVYVEGEGKPLLLLHGFPDSLELWSDVIPTMVSNGYKVIAFDQRGYGGSDAPVGRCHYKLKTIIDDIPKILQELHIDTPVSVMGHDWGAFISWGLAIFYPDLVQSLVVASVGHPTSYGHAGLYQKLVKGFYTFCFQIVGFSEFFLLHVGFIRFMKDHAMIDEVIKKMSRPGRLTAALNWYRANIMDVVLKSWPRCTVPALGIWSTGDAYLTEKQMVNSARYVDAEWSYLRIEGIGHWIPLDAPKQICEYALEWFSRH